MASDPKSTTESTGGDMGMPQINAANQICADNHREREDLVNKVYAVAASHVTKEVAGIRAELEILEPMIKEAIQSKNVGASPEQLDALISGQLQTAADLIPRRHLAGKLAELEFNVMSQNLNQFRQILTRLQSKTYDDLSARMECFQAKRMLNEIESNRIPLVETKFQEATMVWYKLGVDPLGSVYSEIMADFANLAATLDYERSLRPILEESVTESPHEELERQPNPNSNTMILFDAAKYISKFRGDLKEPNVLLQFSNWHSSWNNLVKEMETLRGFNPTNLFQKLKDCLAGPALIMVSRYSSESNNSYAAAMNDLREKFADPISLAGSYIASGIAPRDTLAERAEAIKQSFKALRNMRDVFEREEVDINDCGLLSRPFQQRLKPNGTSTRFRNGRNTRPREKLPQNLDRPSLSGKPEWLNATPNLNRGWIFTPCPLANRSRK